MGKHCGYSHFCGIIRHLLVINEVFYVGIKVYQDRNAIEVILRERNLKFTKQGLDKAFDI